MIKNAKTGKSPIDPAVQVAALADGLTNRMVDGLKVRGGGYVIDINDVFKGFSALLEQLKAEKLIQSYSCFARREPVYGNTDRRSGKEPLLYTFMGVRAKVDGRREPLLLTMVYDHDDGCGMTYVGFDAMPPRVERAVRDKAGLVMPPVERFTPVVPAPAGPVVKAVKPGTLLLKQGQERVFMGELQQAVLAANTMVGPAAKVTMSPEMFVDKVRKHLVPFDACRLDRKVLERGTFCAHVDLYVVNLNTRSRNIPELRFVLTLWRVDGHALYWQASFGGVQQVVRHAFAAHIPELRRVMEEMKGAFVAE